MSKFDENLFGRIALLNHYITREELARCVEVQRAGPTRKHLGEVLLEEGHIDEDQLREILEIRNKKIRKFTRNAQVAAEEDRVFARQLLEDDRVDLEGLESAVLEQQRLRQLNLYFSLAEVLVSRKQIAVHEVLDHHAQQGLRTLSCSVCDAHYRVPEFVSGRDHACPRCDSVLRGPAYLDASLVDGVIRPVGVTDRERGATVEDVG